MRSAPNAVIASPIALANVWQQRRRAQNRASQRAFRERKEKHAQDLQRQLEELEKKHKELLDSHSELDDLNKKLVAEIDNLRRRCALSPSPHRFDDSE